MDQALAAGGVEALTTRARSGRPPKADENYRKRLGEVLQKDPTALGYEFTLWTVDRLRVYFAQEMGIDLSESRLRDLLKREGF